VFSGYEVAAEDLEEDLDVEMGSKKSNVIELYLKTQKYRLW